MIFDFSIEFAQLEKCWVLASSLAPRKVPGRYPGAGSLPGGHYVFCYAGVVIVMKS